MLSNAWFYYFFPLAISVVFCIVGVRMSRKFLRGQSESNQSKYGTGTATGGALLILVGGGMGGAILLTSPTPWQRQQIFDRAFHTPSDQIERVIIKPAEARQYRPLAKSMVVIDDEQRIQQIARILNTSPEVWPNHPRSQWTAKVEIVTRDGSSYLSVNATEPGNPNGTLVSALENSKGSGWNLGDVRADGLEQILEDAVSNAAAR